MTRTATQIIAEVAAKGYSVAVVRNGTDGVRKAEAMKALASDGGYSLTIERERDGRRGKLNVYAIYTVRGA